MRDTFDPKAALIEADACGVFFFFLNSVLAAFCRVQRYSGLFHNHILAADVELIQQLPACPGQTMARMVKKRRRKVYRSSWGHCNSCWADIVKAASCAAAAASMNWKKSDRRQACLKGIVFQFLFCESVFYGEQSWVLVRPTARFPRSLETCNSHGVL